MGIILPPKGIYFHGNLSGDQTLTLPPLQIPIDPQVNQQLNLVSVRDDAGGLSSGIYTINSPGLWYWGVRVQLNATVSAIGYLGILAGIRINGVQRLFGGLTFYTQLGFHTLPMSGSGIIELNNEDTVDLAVGIYKSGSSDISAATVKSGSELTLYKLP